MVTVPAGWFRAGCELRQGCKPESSGPMVPIRDQLLPAFEIDRREVSVGDYRACWKAGFCETANEHVIALAAERRGNAPESLSDPGMPPNPIFENADPRLPMWDVTGFEARAYCAWVRKRLPTALEWEKAARGTDGRPYPWGHEPPTPERTSNAHWNREPPGFPLPVGSQPAGASPYGVLDMGGSLMEYVDPDDDDNRERILIAGSSPRGMLIPSNMVLPQISPAKGLYRRNPEPAAGFRCARSPLSRR